MYLLLYRNKLFLCSGRQDMVSPTKQKSSNSQTKTTTTANKSETHSTNNLHNTQHKYVHRHIYSIHKLQLHNITLTATQVQEAIKMAKTTGPDKLNIRHLILIEHLACIPHSHVQHHIKQQHPIYMEVGKHNTHIKT